MSYSEANGQVVLTMSREDWQMLLLTLGYAMGAMGANQDENSRADCLRLLNRLNQGNPHYTPYQNDDHRDKESGRG